MKDIYQNENIKSPWSGNEIRIDSFLHACFVWYSLAFFWQKAAAKNLLQNASGFHKRATTGFHKSDLVSLIQPYKSNISEEVVEMISTLPTTVIR